MTDLGELRLSPEEKQALYEVKKELEKKYPVAKTLVFGSVARGEADEESDLDILVLTERPMTHREKHDIYAIVTNINLSFDTNISVLVVCRESWENGLHSILPIKEEVNRDGVTF
ncbi:MAG: nucleotidyltransferase domain-containing protein [Bacillota bacterium]